MEAFFGIFGFVASIIVGVYFIFCIAVVTSVFVDIIKEELDFSPLFGRRSKK